MHLLPNYSCQVRLHNGSGGEASYELGSVHMIWGPSKSRVILMLASPNMEATSQLLSLEKPLDHGFHSLKLDLDYSMKKYSRDLCLQLGLVVSSTPLSTYVPSLAS
jgi:hypothetical protein